MQTPHVTDYFAPLGRPTRFEELIKAHGSNPPISFRLLPGKEKFQVDSADRFTYIIMGLAVLIAIVIPLLNLN
jgi:hypothetical protein